MKERLKRYGFRAVVTVLWLGGGYYALFGGQYSIFDLRELEAERASTADRLDSIRQRVDSVAAWADSLERDTLAIQRVAREEHGLIREGEILYRFVPAADDSAERR